MIDLRETYLALAVLASGWSLDDHAAELQRAAAAGGPVASLPSMAPATLGAVVWLVSGDATDCLAELRAAAEALRGVAIKRRVPGLRAQAEAAIDAIESLNLCSVEAAPFVRRFEVAA